MVTLISVVIVNWNGSSFIQKCLKSVVEQQYPSLECIIIDNASTDNSLEIISREFPEAHVIRNTTNTGFAHGCNQGLEQSKGEYVLFLNTDAWLGSNFFQPLLQKIEQEPTIAAIAPKLFQARNPKLLDVCGGFWSTTTWLYHIGYSKDASRPAYNKPTYFFALKGAVLLVRRKHIMKVGAFDDSFWCYYEETDLCHRFLLAGFSCLYYPKSYAYHIGGASAEQVHNALFHFHNFKNQLQSFIKNFSLRTLAWALPIHILLMMGVSVIWVFQGKIRHAGTPLRALWWTMYHISEIIKKRNIVQRIRIAHDSVYLPVLTKNPSLAYIIHAFIPTINYTDE